MLPGVARMYTLKVTLKHVEPPVWQRIIVDPATRLDELSRILEVAMGWEGYHLHQFDAGGVLFGPMDEDDEDAYYQIDEHDIRVKQMLQRTRSKAEWTYDLGDCWVHAIVVEHVDPLTPDLVLPACIDGSGACPPEDCGGVGGYANLLEALADPKHPEHDEIVEWVPEDFDPNVFDIADVNRQLRLLST